MLLVPNQLPSVSPDSPDRPSFSPDGKRVIFTLRGPTWHYPSDICVVGIDGKNLSKLTHSLAFTDKPPGTTRGASYQRYYYSPRYSPDGSRVLLRIDDEVQEREFAAVMDADGSHLEMLAEGRACCWSADGKGVYYVAKGSVIRMDLETHTTRSFAPPSHEAIGPMGRMADREWLAFKLDSGLIGWYNVETGKPVFLGVWAVPPAEMVGQEKLALKGFEWSRPGRVLLWYQGDDTERFEVVRLTNSSLIPQ
jgi:Tol biopolymer transport system component